MMNDKSGGQDPRIEDWPLKKLSVFSLEQIQLLNEYAINTFGQLLGATKGFAAVPDFVGEDVALRQAFQNLSNRFPAEVARYREDQSPFPSTGCWLEDENDEEGSEGDGTS